MNLGAFQGIIPARAGFTSACFQYWCAPPDHPRSRGVYGEMMFISGEAAGSSPLARGLLWPADARERAERIIPARAGFTNTWTFVRLRSWDHPRSRGVYSKGHEPCR